MDNDFRRYKLESKSRKLSQQSFQKVPPVFKQSPKPVECEPLCFVDFNEPAVEHKNSLNMQMSPSLIQPTQQPQDQNTFNQPIPLLNMDLDPFAKTEVIPTIEEEDQEKEEKKDKKKKCADRTFLNSIFFRRVQ